MDLNSVRSTINSVRHEIFSKSECFKEMDNSPLDLFPEKGDVFIKNMSLADESGAGRTISGRVKFDASAGDIERADIEETTADGEKIRYQYVRNEGVFAGEEVLKKTDTGKIKAAVSQELDGSKKVKVEKIDFVESDVTPAIEERSENLKNEVRGVALDVELLDNSEFDKDGNRGIIVIDDAPVYSPGAGVRRMSGSVTVNPDTGDFERFHVADNGGQGKTEYYFSKGNDYKYYKKATPDHMQSTQIFDEGGPKLVLFQEEKTFKVWPES